MRRQPFIWMVLVMILVGAIPAQAEDKVKVTGDNIRGDTEKKVTYINGNVRIVQGSDVITTEKAMVNLEDKLLALEENVTFKNTDVTVTAVFLDYNLKKKNGTFKQKVILERKAAQTAEKGSKKKDPFTLNAEELYFESNTKNFSAKQAKIEHKDFTGSADVIEYNDKLQELVFRGNAYLKKPEGEEVRGDITRINLERKTFVVENNVIVSFDVDDEDEPKKDVNG